MESVDVPLIDRKTEMTDRENGAVKEERSAFVKKDKSRQREKMRIEEIEAAKRSSAALLI